MCEGVAQILLQRAAFFGIGMEGGVVEMVHAAAAILGGIEREIGVTDDRLAGDAIAGGERDAHRRPDHHPAALYRIGLREGGDNARGEIGEIAMPHPAGQDHLELVATEAADLTYRIHRAGEALRHLPQQRIAHRMAHGVVDLLEAVEIDQEHGAGAVLGIGGGEDFFEREAHLEAVGEAGERIVMREARGGLLGAELLGEIVARAAKAEEIVEAIVERASADRPPTLGAFARRAHREIGEGGAGVEVKLEGALAIGGQNILGLHIGSGGIEDEQFGEGAADQFLGIAPEQRANRGRAIGDLALAVGLPEPALPGVFVIGEDFLGAELLAAEQGLLGAGQPVAADLAQRRAQTQQGPHQQRDIHQLRACLQRHRRP